jgi:hypothetical protein
MEEEKQGKPGFPPLHLPSDLRAHYSNLARISHTPAEMVVDFAAMLPGVRPEVVARILMSPVAAKMFWHALGENLARYEATFGPIQIPNNSNLAQDLFRNIHPPDKPEKTEPPESEE